MGTIATRVARGAALLDERRPGWAGEIGRRIDLWDCDECVLGQLYEDFATGVATLDIVEDIAEFGFYCAWKDRARAAAAWTAEIRRRPTEALACPT